MERTPVSRCTKCGEMVNAATYIGGGDGSKKINPGDASICFHCYHIMVYGKDLTLREFTDEELLERLESGELGFLMETRQRIVDYYARK